MCFGALCFLIGPFDYNHLTTYYELAWRFWADAPGLPQYNPYFCGGRTLGADPQVPIFHPILLLVAAFGPAAALKFEMLAALALGTWGLWQWLALWKLEVPNRLWAALLFLCGGFTVARFMVGHVTLSFYFLAPLYFYLSYRFCERGRDRWVILSSLCILFVYCTFYKPNFLIYALPTLVFEAALRSALARSWAPLCGLLIPTAVGGLASAVTLLPAAEYFAQFPRTFDSAPKWVPPSTFFISLLLPLKAIPAAWYGSPFMQRHEYSVFLGPIALFFACCASRRSWPHRNEKLALLGFAIFSFWMGLGFTGSLDLRYAYSWFHGVWPGFESVRVPVRFWFGAYLALAVFSALGFRWPASRRWQALLVVVGLIPLLANAAVNLSKVPLFSSDAQWNPNRQFPTTVRQVHADPDLPYAPVRAGMGVIECVENLEALRSPILREDDMLSYRASAPVTLQAKFVDWNRIQVTGSTTAATDVAFNFNHHPFWTWTGTGATIASTPHDPMTLSVRGSFEGELHFRQPKVATGLAISLLTLTALFGATVFAYRRRRRPWRLGLTGGIGSGKSEVGQLFARAGWTVVDLDAHARRLTDSDADVQKDVRRIFGDSVFSPSGLDRRALREAAFSSTQKRKQLEQLLHPRLMQEFNRQYAQACSQKKPGVVCEAALLVETGHAREMDRLVVVVAPQAQRLERIKKRDGVSIEQAQAVLAIQASDEEKMQHADDVLSNASTLADLERSVQDLLQRLK